MYMYTENRNPGMSKSTSSQKSKIVFSLEIYIALPHAWLLIFSFSKNADKVVNFLKMHDKNC